MINLDLLDNLFKDTFPAKGGMSSLEYVEVKPRPRGDLAIVVRLVVWDVDEQTGVKSIRDVKEQEVYLKVVGLDLATLGRIGEYLRALVAVAAQALAHTNAECMMPADFIDFSALKLVKANTEADFIAALSVPSRLGRYLSNLA